MVFHLDKDGFDIEFHDFFNVFLCKFFISLDDDLHYWKEAVESLPWICVHETDGTATKTYAVFDLPTFFLINRANEIVKRNDVIKDVEAEIKALL